ncbi:MAG: hypothetical protein NZ958_05630 [Bacteroidia bacterium]|nr:hypothetical protein [Bacteroidia bacterium]MDW8088939.1 hypothetical protein [Bacteroidia bacterium]
MKALIQCRQIQVCAWRVKYLLRLEKPLETGAWRALADSWPGSTLQLTLLGEGRVLYTLSLAERKGALTGSSMSADIYAVLLRAEAAPLLRELMAKLESLL